MKTLLFNRILLIFILCTGSLNLIAQRSISGKIIDAQDGYPLIGATIVIKGTATGTLSHEEGKFKLDLPQGKQILIVNYVGYETQEISVKDEVFLEVKMQAIMLEEVVVTGYSSAIRIPKLRLKRRKSKKALGYYPTSEPSTYENESYDAFQENGFVTVESEALSTFSIDVDKASYANVRRFLNDGMLPPPDAVRSEELINYFTYAYPKPESEHPISLTTELSICPWNAKNQLFRIGMKGKSLDIEEAPKSNLVFLLDVSGSMSSPDKLPLLKQSFSLLTDNLRDEDRIAIVVYAGASGLVLPSTSGKKKEKILAALDKLSAGGSTAGAAGLRLAYEVAQKNFIKKGNNRVILATDGDFNVGESSDQAMVKLIEEEREKGVFLSVLGFGTGNLQDSKMEKIADKGNGNYAYIDNLLEAKKVLVNEMSGTLFTIAKDVKLQLEFNPEYVESYRLIGYENRMLDKEDFNDDTKDAGEMGAGHTVTALYELVPGKNKNAESIASVNPLTYQSVQRTDKARQSGEVLTVKFRYKEPDGSTSKLMVHPVKYAVKTLAETSEDYRFSAAVANFGMLLRSSKHAKKSSYTDVIHMAKAAKGADENGYRAEFIRLVELAELLSHKKSR